jgi:putative oxidoreductase
MTSGIDDWVILLGRLSLAALFLIFGWRKLRDFSGTVDQMMQDRVPAPALAAALATFIELPVAFSVAIGVFTRPLAVPMAAYTLGTSLIEHRYWTKGKADKIASLENFYKNLCIVGGFLLLFVTGAGKYSIDALYNIAAR